MLKAKLTGQFMSSGSRVLPSVPLPGPPAVRSVPHRSLCVLSCGRSQRVFRSVQKWHVCRCATVARCGDHPPCLGRPGGECRACLRRAMLRPITASPTPTHAASCRRHDGFPGRMLRRDDTFRSNTTMICVLLMWVNNTVVQLTAPFHTHGGS